MATPLTIYKLIILYMLDNADFPLSNSRISEFILDREYTNYFQLQQALSELVDTKFLDKQVTGNTSYYEITQEGTEALSFFEKEISPEIQEEIRDYLKNLGCAVPERFLTSADYYETPQGGFAVRCQLIEKSTTLVDLNISAPNQEAAKSMCKNWGKKCQELYETILEELI